MARRACSTSTSTPTTTARSSRWPAARASWPAAWSGARGPRREHIDLRRHDGVHPHVGALDVMPVVWLDDAQRGAAGAEALTAAARVGDELGLPVFLYGELATRPEHAERAWLRRGGPAGLARADGGRRADARLRPAARPSDRRRRAGHGAAAAGRLQRRPGQRRRRAGQVDRRRAARGATAGCRACARSASTSRRAARAQVSTNVHDHLAVPLARDRRARAGARPGRRGRAGRAGARAPPSTASPTTCRCTASAPSAASSKRRCGAALKRVE